MNKWLEYEISFQLLNIELHKANFKHIAKDGLD